MKNCNSFCNGIASVRDCFETARITNFNGFSVGELWLPYLLASVHEKLHRAYAIFLGILTRWLCDDEHLRFVEPPVLNCQHIETVSFFLSIQRVRLHQTTTRKVFDVHKWYGGVYWRWQGRSLCDIDNSDNHSICFCTAQYDYFWNEMMMIFCVENIVEQWSNSATQIFVCLPWVCC